VGAALRQACDVGSGVSGGVADGDEQSRRVGSGPVGWQGGMIGTYTAHEVREAWMTAWVLAGKPEDAWQAYASIVQGIWPKDHEELTEMFRQAFTADTTKGKHESNR
jgi:hypothetical protein